MMTCCPERYAAQECVEKFIGAKLDDEEAFPDGDFDEAKAFLSGEQLEYRRIEI